MITEQEYKNLEAEIAQQSEQLAAALAAINALPEVADISKAASDVMAERRRQIEKEGWTPEHDDAHAAGAMEYASACYAMSAGGIERNTILSFWPWSFTWWKPSTPRRDLVKAAALALAAVERIDRAAVAEKKASE